MIETSLLQPEPPIVLHGVTSLSDDHATAQGVRVALEVIEEAVREHGAIDLLLDFSSAADPPNYSLSAHRIWAKGFRQNDIVAKSVNRAAVVGIDSPKFRAEKQHMEDERHKWFTDFDTALEWLRSRS